MIDRRVVAVYSDSPPMDPRDAFEIPADPDRESTQDAAQIQAAVLLGARAGVLGAREDEIDECHESSDEGFVMPELEALHRDHRLRYQDVAHAMPASPKELDEDSPAQVQTVAATLARDLYEKPSTEVAAALFESAMRSRHLLVQVAAAAGARETTRSRPMILEILERGVASTDWLISKLALISLRRIKPDHPAVRRRVVTPPQTTPKNRRSNTAVLTHGTFAPDGTWYQPGGNFYEELKLRRPDLDVYDESFTWSGGYSHAARSAGAALLSQWIPNEGLNTPDFFSHSHGGTVAHLATSQGIEFDRMVHMAVPVHGRWFPDPARFDRLIDIRVRWDLVILADRGGQRFRNTPFQAKIDEHRHGWFNHSAAREPGYWDDHGLWDVL